MSFFSTPLSQSLASIVSLAYEKVVGRVLKIPQAWPEVVVVIVADEPAGLAAAD
jgi:hypothetical protein